MKIAFVGYFHDRDLTLNGIVWLRSTLDHWQELGVERLIDYRELAATTTRTLQVQDCDGSLRIIVHRTGFKELPKPKNILLAGAKQPRATGVMDGIEISAAMVGTTMASAFCDSRSGLSKNKKGPADTARAFQANQINCRLLTEGRRFF